jgi:hypothetical protein
VSIGKAAESSAANQLTINVSGGATPSLQTTFATAGSAGAISTYLIVSIAGTSYKLALYAM